MLPKAPITPPMPLAAMSAARRSSAPWAASAVPSLNQSGRALKFMVRPITACTISWASTRSVYWPGLVPPLGRVELSK